MFIENEQQFIAFWVSFTWWKKENFVFYKSDFFSERPPCIATQQYRPEVKRFEASLDLMDTVKPFETRLESDTEKLKVQSQLCLLRGEFGIKSGSQHRGF